MAERGWPADWAEHGHIAEPADLPQAQASGYWEEVLTVGRAVRALVDPVKLNYQTLGNTVPHLHTHVLPRFFDDPAPGGPIEWAQIHSAGPVPDTDLRPLAASLRALLWTEGNGEGRGARRLLGER